MALAVKDWMKTELGFTDAEIVAFNPEALAALETRAPKIEGGYLRQADYSKKMNELSAKSEQLTAEIADWTETQTTTVAEAKEKQAAIDKLELEHTRLTQIARNMAEQAGVDPTEALKGISEPKPKEPPVATKDFDPTPVYGQISNVAKYLLDLATELPVIAAEHLQLTGEHLDTRKLRAEIETRAKAKQSTDPREVWETLYSIPDKREAARVKTYDAEIAAAEARGREAARSEAAIPGASAPGSHAPVFQNRTSVLQRPQPGRNTAGFAQSLAKGTYRKPMGGSGAR